MPKVIKYCPYCKNPITTNHCHACKVLLQVWDEETLYTQTELNKAVQDERYSNIVELEKVLEKEANEYADMEYIQGVEDCLKAIKTRATK